MNGDATERGAVTREAASSAPDRMRHLRRAEWLAGWMDDRFRIPLLGWRFGLDSLVGLVPWLGDAVSALFGLYLIVTALHYRVPRVVLFRMGVNVALDFLVGLVPVAGDLGDVLLKSNRRNFTLLRDYAEGIRRPTRGDYAFVVAVISGVLIAVALAATLGVLLLRELLEILGALARRP